jgi:hypothetical protein
MWRNMTRRACMAVQVADRRPPCCRGTASFTHFRYVVSNCLALSKRVFTMFSSILLHLFSAQTGEISHCAQKQIISSQH